MTASCLQNISSQYNNFFNDQNVCYDDDDDENLLLMSLPMLEHERQEEDSLHEEGGEEGCYCKTHSEAFSSFRLMS